MRHRSPAPQPRLRRRSTSTPSSRRGRGRVARGALLSVGLTGLLLTVPVLSSSGSQRTTSALDASPAPVAHPTGSSPVVLGVDGSPLTSSPLAGASTPAGTVVPGDGPVADGTLPTPDAPAPGSGEPQGLPSPASDPATGSPTPETAGPPPTPSAPATGTPTLDTTAAGTSTPTPSAAADPAAQVLALVNRERTAAGCDVLAADAGLASLARAHSADMRDRRFFDHRNPDGLDPFQRAVTAGLSAQAENIAMGQADAAAVMAGWMSSPGHRANILDCTLTRLGVGHVEGSGGPWWTQLFA